MDIYIANLYSGVSAEDLKKTFSYLGNISSIRIVQPQHDTTAGYAVINLLQDERPRSEPFDSQYGSPVLTC